MPDVGKEYSECTREVGRFAKRQLANGLFSAPLTSRGLTTLSVLPSRVREFVETSAATCKPDKIHVCDGSEAEYNVLIKELMESGTVESLPKYKNCFLARTNPADVARVESRTFICTDQRYETVPHTKAGVKGTLGNWISTEELEKAVGERFPNTMKGRTMYVIPYSMGPVGSPLAKIGVELTDSAYVVASMRIMTRMGQAVLDKLKEDDSQFVRCLHSVGTPLQGIKEYPNWPCDPERTIILQKPKNSEIISYGSGYGGNSLLGKKCFALRIGSTIAKREGWLAEHMLILGITNPQGHKRYIAAAFPSACGKTNLAMMNPTLPGYKIECVGDDIAWMRFDKNGKLRAINPENGFFGVAPGTSNETNPNAMKTIFENTVFTNVAKTSDGGVYWEGLEKEVPNGTEMVDWKGQKYIKGQTKGVAAHPNSRFCAPANQCPIIDPAWEDPEGVVIDAILFGGRRPEGVPLVYEAFDWDHGVFIGASMRSEATAAAEFKGKVIMHDPFAMRPFFGYNFGNYLDHWLSMKEKSNKLPKIFHVNWFRKDSNGKFLWPGFGENSRVLDWVLKRVEGDDKCATKTPIGYIPSDTGLNLDGLNNVNTTELYSLPKSFWMKEVQEIEKYFDEQVGSDLPVEVTKQLNQLKMRIAEM